MTLPPPLPNHYTILNLSPRGGGEDQNFISLLILRELFNTPYLPTLNTTLKPICEVEGAKILFQSPKFFQTEHFRIKSYCHTRAQLVSIFNQ